MVIWYLQNLNCKTVTIFLGVAQKCLREIWKILLFLKMMLNWSLSSSQWIMIFVSRDNILEDDLSFLTNDRSLFFASLELYDLHTKYPFHDFKKAHSAVCVVPYHILPQKVLEYIYEIVGKAYFPLFIRTKIYNSQFYNTSSKH